MSALRQGAGQHAGHDYHCVPNLDSFPVLMECLDGVEAIWQKFFENLRGMKPGTCGSTTGECFFECKSGIKVELSAKSAVVS